MPDQEYGQAPTGDPDGKPLTPAPTITHSKQGKVTDAGESNPGNVQSETKKKLHWLEIGYFSGQIVLACVGIWALAVYSGQLGVMRGQLDQMNKQYPEIQKSTAAAWIAAEAARDSLTQSEDHFRLDERPYILVNGKGGEGPSWIPNRLDSNKGQIAWNWHMTNYGKSPANNIRYIKEMKLAGHGWQLCHGEKGQDIGPPQLTGADAFDTVLSDTISKDEYKRLLGINEGISIRVRVHYAGMDGTKYETGLGLSRTDYGSIKYSEEGNYMK